MKSEGAQFLPLSIFIILEWEIILDGDTII